MVEYEAIILIAPEAEAQTIAFCCKLTNAARVGVITVPDMIAEMWEQLDEGKPYGRVLRDPGEGQS